MTQYYVTDKRICPTCKPARKTAVKGVTHRTKLTMHVLPWIWMKVGGDRVRRAPVITIASTYPVQYPFRVMPPDGAGTNNKSVN